jgi:hypothetical protein
VRTRSAVDVGAFVSSGASRLQTESSVGLTQYKPVADDLMVQGDRPLVFEGIRISFIRVMVVVKASAPGRIARGNSLRSVR